MTISHFLKQVDLANAKEIDKVRLLAFFHQTRNSSFSFTVDDVCQWFAKLDFHIPNKYRLKQNLGKSHSFVKAPDTNGFRLHANEIKKLSDRFPSALEKNEETVSLESVLPAPVYENTRGYIESLAKQINASYENNIFDGCAVLMRRLLEICLIHSYEHAKIEAAIKDSQGNFKQLADIVNDATTNTKLGLSRNTKDCLGDFRKVGNFSAHKIFYTARRQDIKTLILEYRAAIEELLYKSGIRT